MKKVLVSLLVLAVAVSGVFAAVNVSGSLQTGYVFQYNDENWTNWMFGEDNTDTNSTKLTLSFADDNGYWSSTLEGVLYADGSSVSVPSADLDDDGEAEFKVLPQNRIAGDIKVNLAKMIAGPETDWNAELQLLAFDRVVGLRAYTNKSGLNFDRVRTAEPGLWANVVLGYTDLIQVQIGGAPALMSAKLTNNVGATETKGDFIVSAMTKPLDGLAVSVDWALVGDGTKDGVFGGAADINVGALVGLDFDLGVGIADKYYYGDEKNVLSAQVYGGIDVFSAYGEYVLDDETSRLHFGADINVLADMILNVYGGIGNFDAAEDSWYVGGNVGYTVYGVTFNLNLQYAPSETGKSYMADKGGDIAQGAVKATGFSITPSVSVSF